MTVEVTDRGGPYVKAAFLCDTVIEGKDGVSSYIRVVDTLTVQTRLIISREPQADVEESELPTELPDGSTVHAWLVLSFAGGGARRRSPLKLRMQTPDGLVRDMAEDLDVHFDGRLNSSVNLHVDLDMRVRQEGLYSILVHLDSDLITRVPFEVRYRRMPRAVGGA